jgi:hypothetical protein
MNRPCSWLICVIALLFTGCASDEPPVARPVVPFEFSSWTNRARVLSVQDIREQEAARRRAMARPVSGPFAEYDRRFYATIRWRWNSLLRGQPDSPQKGSALLRFRLYPDGAIREIEVESSTLGEPALRLCFQAISNGAPYERFIAPPEFRTMHFRFSEK